MAAISVSLRNLTKTYSGESYPAVADFSLEVAESEFVVLVGHSGCGKSTVLRMIAGLETPSSGEVYIGGQLCNALEPKDRDIAMVFQSYALYPHMTVRQNMEFGLKLSRRMTRTEIETRVMEAADILDIRPLLDRKPRHLSGGERQRVALGRAIVRKPRVFLFDEPLSNLDANMRAQMRVEIGRLHARLQTTMIYVTHDQIEAMTMGDRIVCMRGGVIQQVGSPIELYDVPHNDYVGAFIGSPLMNFLETQVVEDQLQIRGTQLLMPLDPEDRALLEGLSEVKVGIRPEHLHIRKNGQGIPGMVEVVEPLGFETLVYVGYGTGTLVLRVQEGHMPTVGEKVVLELVPGSRHYFDGQTGMRLMKDMSFKG